jgi:hypothetical protein
MLAKRRCPHTGIINFFLEPEPFMAVGSISETARSKGYIWRSYIGEEAAGLSADMASAEARLARLLASAIVDRPIPRRTGSRLEAPEADPPRASSGPSSSIVRAGGLTPLAVRGALPCR